MYIHAQFGKKYLHWNSEGCLIKAFDSFSQSKRCGWNKKCCSAANGKEPEFGLGKEKSNKSAIIKKQISFSHPEKYIKSFTLMSMEQRVHQKWRHP